MERIDGVEGQVARGGGEDAAVVAVAAGDGFVAGGVDADTAEGLEQESGDVGFSDPGVRCRHEEAHGQEVAVGGVPVNPGMLRGQSQITDIGAVCVLFERRVVCVGRAWEEEKERGCWMMNFGF